MTTKPIAAPARSSSSGGDRKRKPSHTISTWFFRSLSRRVKSVLRVLGPGLVTGSSDDDPSGIATYSQVGAQFGYGMLWTMVLTYPLMAAIQEISARVGRVTGCGISANLRRHYSVWLLYVATMLVLTANIFNLGADIGAMGAAAQLLLPAHAWIYVVGFGLGSLLLQSCTSLDRHFVALASFIEGNQGENYSYRPLPR